MSKSRDQIFLCVSSTFASPIEKPAPSVSRRIYREIIRNTVVKCKISGFSPALQMDQFILRISPGNEKTDRRSGRRRIKKWWIWWLCTGTPIAPQNPTFLSIPRSSLTRYDTSSAAFRLLIYGEKVGEKPFHGEEMGNF